MGFQLHIRAVDAEGDNARLRWTVAQGVHGPPPDGVTPTLAKEERDHAPGGPALAAVDDQPCRCPRPPGAGGRVVGLELQGEGIDPRTVVVGQVSPGGHVLVDQPAPLYRRGGQPGRSPSVHLQVHEDRVGCSRSRWEVHQVDAQRYGRPGEVRDGPAGGPVVAPALAGPGDLGAAPGEGDRHGPLGRMDVGGARVYHGGHEDGQPLASPDPRAWPQGALVLGDEPDGPQ